MIALLLALSLVIWPPPKREKSTKKIGDVEMKEIKPEEIRETVEIAKESQGNQEENRETKDDTDTEKLVKEK